MNIVIIDYGIGNVQSIFNVLNQFKYINVLLSDKKYDILNADGIILPGVGAFKKAMEELNKRNLPTILQEYNNLQKPFLGICLGMQLLFESSEEFGYTKGLGFVNGKVESFPLNIGDKLPHVSWNEICPKNIKWKHTILMDIEEKSDFYFTHSYICKPENEKIVLSTTTYGNIKFCSSIMSGNIHATQFHPEKSGSDGIYVINNFIQIVKSNL